MNAFISETPPKSPESILAEFLAEPDLTEIEKAASVNGGDTGKARRDLILKTQADAKRIAGVSFGVISKLESEREVVMTATANYKRIVRSSTDALNQLEGALRQRADLLQEVEENEKLLVAANDLLASTDSLQLSEGELLQTQQKAKQLPVKIVELKTQVQKMANTIHTVASENEFDLNAVARQMLSANRNARGVILDQRLQSHFNAQRFCL